MAKREITYYSLLSSEHIESITDKMDEQSFITLGFEQKWFVHLWIDANNEAFLEYIRHQTDLNKLGCILGEQLKLYARKRGEGYEKDKGDFYHTYKARKDWLNHTVFICRNEYNKTQSEIFNEVVKWCINWQNEWLETFNPYSPMELKEMSKDLKTPLWEKLNERDTPQTIVKQNPETNRKLITFKNSETIDKIHSELKGYFPNEAELLKALQGEQLGELLLFPHNQNKFVEVFRRLKYNGFILNTDTEIKHWICTNFQFTKKGFTEPQKFNESSVWDILNKGKGEPTKKERIVIEWLPYKSPSQLANEKEKEKYKKTTPQTPPKSINGY